VKWAFLLRVYSGTILAIFIEIGSYLADKEQKIKRQVVKNKNVGSFFETWCINRSLVASVNIILEKNRHKVASKIKVIITELSIQFSVKKAEKK